MATDRIPLLSTVVLGLALLTVVWAPGLVTEQATADHKPADKMAVDGATIEVMTSEVTNGFDSKVVELLHGQMRTSSTTDLVLQVTLECALWTATKTVGNDDSQARAQVKVWVEIDGDVVPVSGQEDPQDPDAGKVVFCDRAERAVTSQFENENATIERFHQSRHANAFNWIMLNLGNDVHEIVVKAQLESEASGDGLAQAAIGKRTLVAEPVKLSNHASI